MPKYSIGIDYGTSSVRALVVRCNDGAEIGTAVWPYAHGDEGIILDPSDAHLARQHPQDYINGLIASVRAAVSEAQFDPSFDTKSVVGIGVDTTASTPLPVDEHLVPLALKPEFAENPNAMAWLWKDHTSTAEADEISEKADAQALPYMRSVGGRYSSEWFWAKILRCARVAPEVFAAAHTWLELQDFIPAYLAGATSNAQLKRGVCAAGHKGLFNPDWGGLPSREYLRSLDPRLEHLRNHLFDIAYQAGERAGELAPQIAQELGLPAGIPIAVGGIDAHMGAVGAGVRPGRLVKIIGTSSCDILVAPPKPDGELPDIPGVAGVVNGSVLPGMIGIEAGQPAIGDLFNWFVKHVANSTHEELTQEASKLRPGQSGLLALEWNNGNRSVLMDQRLTGLLIGQTLHTSTAEIYRALIEATAFGALTILSRLEHHGVVIDEIVTCGGIAEKNPMLMQIYADVCNRPMKISRSSQTPALGAAIFGAVVGGAHASVREAQDAMTGIKEAVYQPNPHAVATYARLYKLYSLLYDGFGGLGPSHDLGGVMKELLAVKER